MQIDKKHIGHEFKAFTSVAEAGKLRLFCKAIGEEDPIYQSEEAAKAAGYPRIPVSPTFLQALTNDDPEKGGLLKLIYVDIVLKQNNKQHNEKHTPKKNGDKVTCLQKIVVIYDKKSGALWCIVSETSMKNEAGKMVAKATGITVVRNPDAGKK